MKRFTVILILYAFLIANAACGKVTLEGGMIYADMMVTQKDAEKIFGVPMRLHSLQKNAERNFCYYTDAADSYNSNLEASFQTYADAESAKSAAELMRESAARNGEIETIEGFGDAAFLRRGAGEQAIYVRRNKVLFMITFSGDMSKGAGLEGVKSLSREIVEML